MGVCFEMTIPAADNGQLPFLSPLKDMLTSRCAHPVLPNLVVYVERH